MSHVDDGALHALLDGQLDSLGPDEAGRVRTHLGACVACRERLEEAHEVRRRATALFEAQDPLAGVELPTLADLRRQASDQDAPVGRGRARRRLPGWIPLGWAATVALALGVGYGIGVVGPGVGPAVGPAAGSDPMPAAPAVPAAESGEAVASQQAAEAAPEAAAGAPPSATSGAAFEDDVSAVPGRATSGRSAILAASEDTTRAAAATEAGETASAAPTPELERTASAADRPAIPEPEARKLDVARAPLPRMLPDLWAFSDTPAARLSERREADVTIAPTGFERARRTDAAGQLPLALAGEMRAADEDAGTPLVVPGLRVVEVVSEDVWPGQQGVRLVQAFPDGRQVELRVAGPPAAGAGPVRPPPTAAAGLPPGWSRTTRPFGGGWAELRGPLTGAELEALLDLLAPEG
jgi:hypothetical protein